MTSSLDLNNTVQPPSLVSTPTPLSLPPVPEAQLGGLFHGGCLSWSVADGTLYICDTSTGACLQNWAPSMDGDEITTVVELYGPSGPLLVVSIAGPDGHMIGVLSSNWGKLIRSIRVPYKITALHPFNFEGFSSKHYDAYSRPDMFPNSVLSLFNGIVAVGTAAGHVYLVDLQLAVNVRDSTNDWLNNPAPLHVIEGPLSKHDIASMSETGHVTVEVSKGCFKRGKFMYLQSLLPTSSVVVTAMHFAPQISALFVGYSFGGFQIFDMSSFQLLHTSAISTTLPPVTHFTYVEPENDPRQFVYVWLVRGECHSVEESWGSGASASLYQMIFSDKTSDDNGRARYRGFQGCGLRFEHILNDNPHSVYESPGTRVLKCVTPTKYRQEQPENSLELDLSQTVLVWAVPSRNSVNSSREKDWNVFVALFDINQWYHSQMPRALRWKSKGKYAGLFGCSYFSFYNLSSVFSSSDHGHIVDVLLKEVLPFSSPPPLPETFMWPVAAKLTLKLMTSSSVTNCTCLGVQRMVLRKLDECRGSLFAQPEVLFHLCSCTELLPPSFDHTPSTNLSTQRAALLGVVISHGAPTRILTAFADSWVGAGGEDPVISQWVKSTRAELDQARKAACDKCFSSDQTTPLTLSGGKQKVLSITVLLERLLSRGFEREEQHGSLYHLLTQLYQTLGEHKMIMEVVRFLNEQGLGSNYPSAALRHKYDMLRSDRNKLAIDYLIEDHQDDGIDPTPQYPPHSLFQYMEFLTTFDPLIQHCLVLYLLADLGSLSTDPSLSPVRQYTARQELPNELLNSMLSLWLVDNLKIKDPAYAKERSVLFTKVSAHPLFPWQHSVVVQRVMQCGEVGLALSYLRIHGGNMNSLEEIKLKIGVNVGNGQVSAAYQILSWFEGSENHDELLKFFLECCVEGKYLHCLLDLPLTPVAETATVLYLEQHPTLVCRELLVLYFITHHRIVEALAMQEKIRPLTKSDPDPLAMTRSDQRDTLLAGLASVVPTSLHQVKLTRVSRKSQSSKVKVQVEKSLSSVVAKAIKRENVCGGSGAVYSLIQAVMDKRVIPNQPMTPLKTVSGSVTELSRTPFLSTPISVKKIRAPLTGSKPHPVYTPKPSSRPSTPLLSRSYQRFESRCQSLKERLLKPLGNSPMEITLDTPSPVKWGGVPHPLVTPTSILKAPSSASKLTDKKIRFAVEGVLSSGKEKQPLAPSSLATVAVAMTTPLPCSDDEDNDVYESPVESPSQLHTPTPTHTPSQLHSPTPVHTPYTSVTTKLDYQGADDTPEKVMHDVAMETDGQPTNDDNLFVEEYCSDDDEEKLAIPSPQTKTATPPQRSPLSSTTSPVQSPSHSVTPPKRSPSFLQGVRLTRNTLSLSVSPPPKEKKISFTQSLRNTSHESKPIGSNSSTTPPTKPFTPITTTTTPGSHFFSPIPYFSDLVQEKEKARSVYYPSHESGSIKSGTSTANLFTSVTKTKTPASQLFSPVPLQSKKGKVKNPSSKQQTATKTTVPSVVSQSSFSGSMVPNMGVATTPAYSFTPPTRLTSDQPPVVDEDKSESISYAFSPPLTRSAARKRRGDSEVRGDSMEPRSLSPEPHPLPTTSTVKKSLRGRPPKVTLPTKDEIITFVTPPSANRPMRERPKARVKPVETGVAPRRSKRLLSGKK